MDCPCELADSNWVWQRWVLNHLQSFWIDNEKKSSIQEKRTISDATVKQQPLSISLIGQHPQALQKTILPTLMKMRWGFDNWNWSFRSEGGGMVTERLRQWNVNMLTWNSETVDFHLHWSSYKQAGWCFAPVLGAYLKDILKRKQI